ncbi:MAG: alpha-L-fucosidase [Verrucomicrobiales bacterium]
MSKIHLSAVVLMAALIPSQISAALAEKEAPEAREARMGWWREARFGMFVHWGLYSGLAGNWKGKKVADSGGMEWIQQRVGVDTNTYFAEAAPKFQPKQGFATEWADLAKEAGCRYLVFTTKHHEGFSLHDSKAGNFDAGDLLQRDLVKEITEATRAAGLKVGYYHSVIDWHHPEYDFTRSTKLPYPKEAREKATAPRDHAKYIEYLHKQVGELLANYGKVDVVWWDYSATDFQGDEAWKASDLMAMVRKHQPATIMNNRLYRLPEAGFDGMGTHNITTTLDTRYGDFITPENHVPPTGMPGTDWETCMTMNTTWGYSIHDKKWKSAADLIRTLSDISSKGGNLLLNIGPKGDGSVPEESVASLRRMGEWMKVNGEAIYGTTAGGAVIPKADARLTRKGDVLYLHLHDLKGNTEVTVPGKFSRATWLQGGTPATIRIEGETTIVETGDKLPDPDVSVIKLEP